MKFKRCLGVIFYIGNKKENPDSILFDHLVCKVTKSRFSHVELVLYKTESGKYLCYSSSHRDRGVRFTEIDIDPGHWVFIKPNNPPTLNEVYNFDKKYGHSKYDYLGLLSTVIPKGRINIDNRMFCSELVGDVFNIRKPYRLSPQSLFEQFNKE